jgi:hypothetical protein
MKWLVVALFALAARFPPLLVAVTGEFSVCVDRLDELVEGEEGAAEADAIATRVAFEAFAAAGRAATDPGGFDGMGLVALTDWLIVRHLFAIGEVRDDCLDEVEPFMGLFMPVFTPEYGE